MAKPEFLPATSCPRLSSAHHPSPEQAAAKSPLHRNGRGGSQHSLREARRPIHRRKRRHVERRHDMDVQNMLRNAITAELKRQAEIDG
ncbi:hypothetical protein LKMONMHP_2677 [Methylobacterium organophilum]|uniref:Uncharacterized protein n=1 Tax=Methylobacterium organophilum TaxID=410 RepID=A0ABQ4TAA6_METOR|nr:hypothetical protein LKMONMHP_2677 [Methylobacterium organophilum]